MSFAHKIVLWMMQRQGYLITKQKVDFFATLYLTSEAIFFSEIVRVASSTNACELTEWFVLKL